MNLTVAVAIAVVIGAAVFFSRGRAQAPPPANANPAIYPELREKALSGSRTALALPPVAGPTEPWGVLMDIGFTDGGSFTTVAMSDGSASIYLSSGGGFIGGHSHEAIRTAAQSFVKSAAAFQAQMKITKIFPLPAAGQTTFYVLTDSGVYTASASEQYLGEQKHRLSPLFYAGQELITQYRLIQQSR